MMSPSSWTVTHPDQTTWAFDANGYLTTIRDRYGNESRLTYNNDGQLTTISDPAGRGSLTLGYDTAGRLRSVGDWLDPVRVVQYDYSPSGYLETVTDRLGKTTTYGYHPQQGRLTTITDANGHVVVTNTYDSQGRVETQRDARGLTTGQQTAFAYVTLHNGYRTTVTYPATSYDASWNPTVEDTYDAQGRLSGRVSRPTAP